MDDNFNQEPQQTQAPAPQPQQPPALDEVYLATIQARMEANQAMSMAGLRWDELTPQEISLLKMDRPPDEYVQSVREVAAIAKARRSGQQGQPQQQPGSGHLATSVGMTGSGGGTGTVGSVMPKKVNVSQLYDEALANQRAGKKV